MALQQSAGCLLALRRNIRAAGNHDEGLVRSVKWSVLSNGVVLFQVSVSVGSVRGRAPAITIHEWDIGALREAIYAR